MPFDRLLCVSQGIIAAGELGQRDQRAAEGLFEVALRAEILAGERGFVPERRLAQLLACAQNFRDLAQHGSARLAVQKAAEQIAQGLLPISLFHAAERKRFAGFDFIHVPPVARQHTF